MCAIFIPKLINLNAKSAVSTSGTSGTSDGRESFVNLKSQMGSELKAMKNKLEKSEAEVARLQKSVTSVEVTAEKDDNRV